MSEREGEVERGIKKLETTLCFFPVLPVSSLFHLFSHLFLRRRAPASYFRTCFPISFRVIK